MSYSRRIILRKLLITIFLPLAVTSNAQELWGIVTSNFAGSTGTLLNPCAINTSKLYLDINIITIDAFFENNYAFVHKEDYKPFDFLKGNFPEYGPDAMPFDHYTNKNNKYFYASELIKGPSFMLSSGLHAYAVHTGVRSLFSANAIPQDIANFGYYGLEYEEQQNINYKSKNFGSAGILIGEVGFTYAYSFRKISMEDWTAGITVKRFFSPGGGYLRTNDLDYIVVNDTTINIKNLNAEVGYSLPLDYDNNDFPDSGPLIKGGGWGFDIGVTFQNKVLSYQKKRITRLCSQRYVDYYYKIGISLLDIGFINFKTNAQQNAFNNVSEYWVNVDTLDFNNMNDMRRTISDVFYGDPEASSVSNEIRMHAPTAFSIQGDYRITKKWYAGAVWIHPVRLGSSYIRRPAQVVLIPRYETPHLEFSLPFSLYDYHHPRLGFSVRYHVLTFGSDDFLSLLGFTNFTGFDLFVALKINYRKGNCGKFRHDTPCENNEYGVRRR
jgi:hypothetical protein